MTPELLEAGAETRSRAFTRIAIAGEPIFNQGVALYVEDLKVAFDGFQALGGFPPARRQPQPLDAFRIFALGLADLADDLAAAAAQADDEVIV